MAHLLLHCQHLIAAAYYLIPDSQPQCISKIMSMHTSPVLSTSSLVFFLMKRTCLFATPVEETLLEWHSQLTWPKISVSHFLEQGEGKMIRLVCHTQGEEKQKLIMGSRACSQIFIFFN